MKWRIFSLLLVCILLLSGCTATPEASDTAAQSENGTAAPTEATAESTSQVQPVTFVDDLGRTVTAERPQRVAALLGSFAQIWMLAGGEVVATADDAWEDLHLELPADAVNLGGTEDLNLELLLAAQPDFILASPNRKQNVEWQDTLEKAGIPTAYFDVSGFEDYLRVLKICTELTGREDLYAQNGQAVQEQVASVLAEREKYLQTEPAPTVLTLVASAASVRVKNSKGNVLSEMLDAMGCVNIADSDAMLLEDLSIEHILLQDPDYIFIVQRGDNEAGMRECVRETLTDDPLWSELTAVKEDRVYFMDKNLFNLKPNQRWGEAYMQLAEILNHD